MVLTDGILAAKNGDLKAPVGTYELAIACYFHSIPFYAVLNADDVDLEAESGAVFGQEEGDPPPSPPAWPVATPRAGPPPMTWCPPSSSPA